MEAATHEQFRSTSKEVRRMKEKKARIARLSLLLFFGFLEQVLNRGNSRLLRQSLRRHESQSFFRTPLHTLRTISLVFAAVAREHHFFLWMHHHGSELARADAPCAPVACFLVDHDDSRAFFLSKRIFRASSNARWILAVPA